LRIGGAGQGPAGPAWPLVGQLGCAGNENRKEKKNWNWAGRELAQEGLGLNKMFSIFSNFWFESNSNSIRIRTSSTRI
jgi:hypothetical protein